MPRLDDSPFALRYENSLREHLERRPQGRQTSRAGHSLGREAATLGFDAAELVGLHDRALSAIVGPQSPPHPHPLRGELSAPAIFFLEVLRPVESARRTAPPATGGPRSEEERSLGHQLLLAQENERLQCSRELRDEITQILAGAHLHLSALAVDGKTRYRSEQKAVARTQHLLDRSISALQRLARQLHPAMLENLGLIPTLRALLADLFKDRPEQVELSTTGEPEHLDPMGRTVLYRVALEALTDIARHARATAIWVSVESSTRSTVLRIRDDGPFPDEPAPIPTDASGRLRLKGMRERVEMLGGHFSHEAAPVTGTRIEAEIPSAKDPPTVAL